MPKLDPALWRDMMEYLRRRHAPICRQWFEELQPLGLDSGLLRVFTNSSVQQNYLQRKCVDQFQEAAQVSTGSLIAVRFVNSPESRPPAPGSGSGNGGGHSGGQSGGQSGGATATSTVTGKSVSNHSRSPGSPPPSGFTHGGRGDAGNQGAYPGAGQSGGGGASGGEIHFEEIDIVPDYSFENFVPGPGNQLAYSAAVAVSNQPGESYNPLFIHGGVGLGKTHLLQAICQTILHRKPAAQICYLSCDAFMNQFMDCVQRGLMNEFRHRYRHVDVLVIDDIHFLSNKERSQEEFFHTFNELHQARKQIVLSSDAPPGEIPQLEERLVSRFQWGLVANISRPDYETRSAIVRAKAKLRGLDLPDDVIAYIATRIDSNARELEGALTTIQGHAQLQNKPIDLPIAQKALGEPTFESRTGQVTLQNIIDAVTAYYGVRLADLQSKRRPKSITMPRQVCMWLARRKTRFSLQEIGAYFGGRDHTTVMHSIDAVNMRIAKDPAVAQQIAQLEEKIGKPG